MINAHPHTIMRAHARGGHRRHTSIFLRALFLEHQKARNAGVTGIPVGVGARSALSRQVGGTDFRPSARLDNIGQSMLAEVGQTLGSGTTSSATAFGGDSPGRVASNVSTTLGQRPLSAIRSASAGQWTREHYVHLVCETRPPGHCISGRRPATARACLHSGAAGAAPKCVETRAASARGHRTPEGRHGALAPPPPATDWPHWPHWAHVAMACRGGRSIACPRHLARKLARGGARARPQ